VVLVLESQGFKAAKGCHPELVEGSITLGSNVDISTGSI